jgi:DNA-binding CsgD family transcriptional regulator
MSFSFRTLAAFSRTLGAIYHERETHPAGRARSSTEAELVRQGSAGEDIPFLVALLQSHRVPPGVAPAASSDAGRFGAPLRVRLLALGLTPRECEVVVLIAEGKRDAEIAAILGCAPKTVSKHVEHLLAKLGAETRLAAACTIRELSDRPS